MHPKVRAGVYIAPLHVEGKWQRARLDELWRRVAAIHQVPSEEVLSLLSELGIAFAAFVAIFFAFSRGLGEFSVSHKLRVRTILFCCFWVMFAGLVPLLLANLDSPERLKLSAATLLFAFSALAIDSFRYVQRMPESDRRSVQDTNFYVTWILAIGVFASLLSIVTGLAMRWQNTVYLFAAALGLGLCTTNFISIAFDLLFGGDVERRR